MSSPSRLQIDVRSPPKLQTVGREHKGRSAESIVVVGNGPVGFHFLSELVRQQLTGDFQVTVFGEERCPAYDRIHLTRMLEECSEESLELQPRSWYASHGIRLHTDDPVVHIDRRNSCVTARSGRIVHFDRLVLATGSSPYLPPISGVDLPGVFAFRTVEDVEQIRMNSEACDSAVVLGGGLLGLEAAFALREFGLHVTVVEMASTLMPQQLDNASGSLLEELIRSSRLEFRLQRRAQVIRRDGTSLHVELTSDENIVADMVVVAAGIRPRDELAGTCDLPTGRRGGFVVDDQLQTAEPNIYAIGECAEHNGHVYGLAAPGFLMAKTLADNIQEKVTAFGGCNENTWLKVLGVNVVLCGEYLEASGTESLVWSDTRGYIRLFCQNRFVTGMIAVGEVSQVERIQNAIAEGSRLSRWQMRRLRTRGKLWRSDQSLAPQMWPSSKIICNCTGVTKARIQEAVSAGCQTPDALTEATSAGSVCGSCRPLLQNLSGSCSTAPVTASVDWPLVIVSIVAFAAITTTGLLSPIAWPQSVQVPVTILQYLVSSFFWKQVTGFTVVGLISLSLVLSLRKRTSILRRVSFASLRVFHVLAAVAALAVLILHTGLHYGHNLNFLLSVTLITASLTGVATGLVSAFDQRLPVAWHSLRRRVAWLHVFSLWPLPVLVVFHIVAVYAL